MSSALFSLPTALLTNVIYGFTYDMWELMLFGFTDVKSGMTWSHSEWEWRNAVQRKIISE